jgi:hypothetical protein
VNTLYNVGRKSGQDPEWNITLLQCFRWLTASSVWSKLPLRPLIWLKRSRPQTGVWHFLMFESFFFWAYHSGVMKGCSVLGWYAASLGGSRRFEGMCRLHLQGFFIDLDPPTRRQCFLSKRRLPEDGNLFVIDQWWANYGPRARPGPLKGSIRPATWFLNRRMKRRIIKENK